VENEPEVIRDQMQETRTALTDKLEALEHQVVSTVQSITNPVVETVETVKKAVEDTVCAVKDTVQSTVSTMTGAAEQTMETVKETFNLSHQVARHPWLMMIGAAAVGYIGGRLLLPDNTGSSGRPTTSGSPFPDSMNRMSAAPEPPRHNGHHDGARAETRESESSEENWFSGLTDMFGSEINQLKALGVGALVGVVRDLVTQNLGGEMGSRLKDWLNKVTEKMGGKPFSEPLIKPTPEGSDTRFASGCHRDPGDGPRI